MSDGLSSAKWCKICEQWDCGKHDLYVKQVDCETCKRVREFAEAGIQDAEVKE